MGKSDTYGIISNLGARFPPLSSKSMTSYLHPMVGLEILRNKIQYASNVQVFPFNNLVFWTKMYNVTITTAIIFFDV